MFTFLFVAFFVISLKHFFEVLFFNHADRCCCGCYSTRSCTAWLLQQSMMIVFAYLLFSKTVHDFDSKLMISLICLHLLLLIKIAEDVKLVKLIRDIFFELQDSLMRHIPNRRPPSMENSCLVTLFLSLSLPPPLSLSHMYSYGSILWCSFHFVVRCIYKLFKSRDFS